MAVHNRFKAKNGNLTVTGNIVNPSNAIGSVTPTHLAVESSSDSTLRWQVPSDLYYRTGQTLATYSDRGRMYSPTSTNITLQSGAIYGCYCNGSSLTWTLPTVANSGPGDIITIVSLAANGGWSSTATLTIAKPNTNVSINMGVASFLINSSTTLIYRAICSWNDGTNAWWAIG